MARSRRRFLEPVTLCAEDAAAYCGWGVKQFRAECKAGNGPMAFNPRRHRDPQARSLDRFAIADLDAWMASQRVRSRLVPPQTAAAPTSPVVEQPAPITPGPERRGPGWWATNATTTTATSKEHQ